MTDVGQSREDPRNLIKSPGASLLTPKPAFKSPHGPDEDYLVIHSNKLGIH